MSGNCEAHMVAGDSGLLWFVNPRARIASTPEDDGRVNGTVYYSRQQGEHDRLQATVLAGLRCSHRWRCVPGARGSWKVGGRVPGQIFPGTGTFNFGYSMMALLSDPTPGSSSQSIGVLYQNGWTENRGGNYNFVCSDPCCSPSAAHPQTPLCGVVFATMSVTLDDD